MKIVWRPPERHLAEAERHVAHQRELVARLERDRHDTAQAILLLEQFEEVLTIRVAYRDRLRKEFGLLADRLPR